MIKNIFLIFNSIVKRKFLLSFTLTFFILTANAQGPTLQWVKSMGDNLFQYATSLDVDAQGNVYTTGVFAGIVDFDPGPGTFTLESQSLRNTFISKFDAFGNFVWVKQLRCLATWINSYNGGTDIVLDKVGNIYVSGYFTSGVDFDPGPGNYNLFSSCGESYILKLNSSGNFIRANQTRANICDLTTDASSNVFITGDFTDTTDFDFGIGISNLVTNGAWAPDIFILKINSLGTFQWVKQMGFNGVFDQDQSFSIKVDQSGNIYTTGFFQGSADFDPNAGSFILKSNGGWDVFVSKLSSTGNFIWAKGFGSKRHDMGISLTLDIANNIYTTGRFKDSVDFNPGTGTYSLISHGNDDVYISKLDPLGNFLWANTIGSDFNDVGMDIEIDPTNNVYVSGLFQDTAYFNPIMDAFNLQSKGSDDIFVVKFDGSGNFVGAKSIGGTLSDYSYTMRIDGAGNIYLAGGFQGICDFDPDLGVYNLTSVANSDDIFILKMGGIVGIQENTNSFNQETIFPNPNNGLFTLQVSAAISNGELILINSIGQKVYEEKIIQGINTVQTNGLAKGLYNYILLSDKQKINSGKLVVE